MKTRDLFHDVFLNLTRKKMRTALTMVGVIIGALAVVTTVSLGHGLSSFLDQQVRAVANPLTVEAWPKKGGRPGSRGAQYVQEHRQGAAGNQKGKGG